MESDTPEMQAVLRRIETLEKENRRLWRTGLALAVLAVAVFGMGQTKPKPRTVEAEQFILRDGQGRARLTIGTPRFSEAAMGIGTDSPVIRLMDDRGTERVILTTQSLYFVSEGLERAASIQAAPGGGGDLLLFDSKGKKRFFATTSLDNPHLWLADDDEALRLSLSVNAKEPTVTLSDSEGFQTSIGATDLVTPRTGETHKTSAASLVMFGKDNKVLWSAP
jgi:hypothetical protein